MYIAVAGSPNWFSDQMKIATVVLALPAGVVGSDPYSAVAEIPRGTPLQQTKVP